MGVKRVLTIAPRPRRIHVLAAGLFCFVLLVRHFTNVFDIVFYLLWPDTYTFPLSIHCNRGRLGNQICTYATLYGLSRLNQRHFVLQSCNKGRLRHVFKGPDQTPAYFQQLYFPWHTYELWPWLKPTDAVIPRSTNYIDGYLYPCSFTFFEHVRSDLRRQLTFHDHLLDHAQAVLRAANVHGLPINTTFVGVHVRRGDYQKRWLEAFEGVPVNAEYFRVAVQYFRDKYRNLVFVAVSDDRLWCVEHLSTEFDAYPLPLSLHCNAGRLGNQICTYATLYGLSRLNKRDFVVQECNKEHLSHVFKGPSQARSLKHYIGRSTYNILPYLKPQDAAIPKKVGLIKGYLYPCSFTFFDHVRSDLRRELTFQDHLTSHAQAVLRAANVHGLPNATFVGVHVRRGDYQKRWLEAFEGVPVNAEYFRRAVQYFRDKYRDLVFVAVSDDRLWCVEHLSKEFGMYVPRETCAPEYDLAVLAACNHTIMTYGTFGFWGAYLAGGEVVYFDKFLRPNTTFTKEEFLFEKMYLPNWKGIVTVNVTEWFSRKNNTV